jgi:hypothetical protein
MQQLFSLASKVSTMWSLAAFAIAALVMFANAKKPAKQRSGVLWGVVLAIVTLGLVPIIGALYVQVENRRTESTSLYRVRVIVLDLKHIPTNNARVWSSYGGEPKKIDAGWEFDIPAVSKPAGGSLVVYASRSEDFLSGESSLTLDQDFFPLVNLQIRHDTSAEIRGMIKDKAGRTLEGVRISVVGYNEAVVTTADGQFVLPAHAANDQQVELHAEKRGYQAIDEWHFAGKDPVVIRLERR